MKVKNSFYQVLLVFFLDISQDFFNFIMLYKIYLLSSRLCMASLEFPIKIG